MWGNMGTLQQISALVVGEMWGLRFCSTERRLGTIGCSLVQDGGEGEGILSNAFRHRFTLFGMEYF